MEIASDKLDDVKQQLRDAGVPAIEVGRFADHARLTLAEAELDAELDELRDAWLRPLDW